MKKSVFLFLVILFWGCNTDINQKLNFDFKDKEKVFIQISDTNQRKLPPISFSFYYPKQLNIKQKQLLSDSLNYIVLYRDSLSYMIENVGFGICKFCNLSIAKITVKSILNKYMEFFSENLPNFQLVELSKDSSFNVKNYVVKFYFSTDTLKTIEGINFYGKYLGIGFIVYPDDEKQRNAIFIYMIASQNFSNIKNFDDFKKSWTYWVSQTIEFY